MFDELKKAMKAKDRLASKAYATILTNYGGLNVELHGDRAPKTVYNFVQLAKQGYYDNVKFHRLIPGFMVNFFPWPGDQQLTVRFKEVIQQELDGVGNRFGEIHSEMSTERRELSSTMQGVYLYVDPLDSTDDSQWQIVDLGPTALSSSLHSHRRHISMGNILSLGNLLEGRILWIV
jgi:cyclophilin family peptidyl-prolyl cis-trans isomerase